MSNADVVRALIESYLKQDRDAADRLIADAFTFTSPQDDHIDKAAFFETCFPATTNLTTHRVLEIVPTEGGGVFVLYEYDSLQTGKRHRNVEYQTVEDGKVTETQVFFGGPAANA